MSESLPLHQESAPHASMNAKETRAFLEANGAVPYPITPGAHDKNAAMVWIVPDEFRKTFFKMFPDDKKPSMVLLKGICEVQYEGSDANGKRYALFPTAEAHFVYYALSPEGVLEAVKTGGQSHSQYIVSGSALLTPASLFETS